MANKKISQLSEAASVEAADLFPLAESLGASNYTTKQIAATGISEYALNPISSTQVSGLNKNFFINNTSWDTAATTVTQNPYLQVRQTDGKLVTGSGIGNAVGGDNMGNCQATTTLDMQSNWLSGSNFSVTGVNDIYFNSSDVTKGPRIEKGDDPGTVYDLKVQAGQDLTLSGLRHVSIKGQGLDLASTPISGDVTFTGGHVTVDPAKTLYVNEINTYVGATSEDRAVLSISGAARFHTDQADAGSFGEVDIDWVDSNVQYDTVDPSNLNYVFTNVRDGQTVTMYIENTSATTTYTPTFASGAPNTVLWGGTGGPPHIAPNRTNVYTFAAIHTGIFASAITGYVY